MILIASRSKPGFAKTHALSSIRIEGADSALEQALVGGQTLGHGVIEDGALLIENPLDSRCLLLKSRLLSSQRLRPARQRVDACAYVAGAGQFASCAGAHLLPEAGQRALCFDGSGLERLLQSFSVQAQDAVLVLRNACLFEVGGPRPASESSRQVIAGQLRAHIGSQRSCFCATAADGAVHSLCGLVESINESLGGFYHGASTGSLADGRIGQAGGGKLRAIEGAITSP